MRTIIAATIGLALAFGGTWLLTASASPAAHVAGGVLVSVGACLMVLTWLRLRWLAAAPYEHATARSGTPGQVAVMTSESHRAAAG